MMDPRRRKRVVVPVVAFTIAMGALARSKGLGAVRTVDALLLFAAGMAAGVLLTALLSAREPSD